MKKLTGVSLFIFFVVVTAILTAGLVFYQNNKDNNVNTGSTANQKKVADIQNLATAGLKVLDKVEVSRHNTISDCWIIVNNKVYDISGYASAHPGGTRNIADSCVKESTQAYDTKGGRGQPHSSSAQSQLDQYYVGDLNQKISQSTLDQTALKIKSNPVSINTRNGEYEDD